MAEQLPIQIQLGALPPQVAWTPQQLGEALVERMRLVSAQSFSLFVSGTTEPSSNSGPWLKDNNQWWVWSDSAGAYVPITVPSESLGYYVGPDTPDETVTTFWIETNIAGSPLALKIYYSGAWVDVYATTLAAYQTIAAFNTAIANYSTTTQMNTAISTQAGTTLAAANAYTDAQIAGLPGSVAGTGIFKAVPSIAQDVVFGAGGNMAGAVALGSETFDPDGVFAANAFTAPTNGYYTFQAALGASVSVGSPTNVDLRAFFGVDGSDGDSLNDEPISTSLAGRVMTGATTLYLNAGQVVTLRYNFTLDAAGTVEIATNSFLTGYRIR